MKRKKLHIVLQTIIWLLFLGIFILSLGFTEKQRNEMLCNQIKITILDSHQNHFVKPNEIIHFLSEKGFKIRQQKINSLPLNQIETELNKISYVEKAEIYTTLDGVLNIEIIQRTPMFRIINYNYESYYVDKNAVLFPLSDNYSARVLIVNGNINEPYALFCNKKAYESENQDVLKRETLLDDIFYLANAIYHDSLWSGLIEQVYVNSNKEFELIPKLGNFIIEFGDTSELETKFVKLREFYRQVVSKTGGGQYSKVNVKFKNQLVCTKKNTLYESE